MIKILSVPMIVTGFVTGFFFFFNLFLSLKTKSADKQSRSYLIFSILSLINTIYVLSFFVLMNSSNNLEVLNIANRITIISSMFVILLALHFNKYFFDIPGKKDLILFYILNTIFSIACFFNHPIFLAKKYYATSRFYTGLEFGILFRIWGIYAIIIMFYAMFILIRGYLLYFRTNKTYSYSLLFLLLASIIWNYFGVLDALTGIHIIDLPPLSWVGSLIMILCIEILLVMKIETLFFRFQTLYKQIIYDNSTNVFSRSYFEMELDKKLSEKKESSFSYYLILVDIDDFKTINNNYGHESGDIVLKRIAGIMKQNLRQLDIIARYGGDEFIIFMSHCGGVKLTFQIIERIRIKIQEETFTSNIPFQVTCSFGITFFDQDSINNIKLRDDIIAKADSALYQAKQKGKNIIYILNLKDDDQKNK